MRELKLLMLFSVFILSLSCAKNNPKPGEYWSVFNYSNGDSEGCVVVISEPNKTSFLLNDQTVEKDGKTFNSPYLYISPISPSISLKGKIKYNCFNKTTTIEGTFTDKNPLSTSVRTGTFTIVSNK